MERRGYPGGRDDFSGRSRSRGNDDDRGEYRGRGGRGGQDRGGRGGGGYQGGGAGGFKSGPKVFDQAKGGEQVQLLSNHFKFGLRDVGGFIYAYKV